MLNQHIFKYLDQIQIFSQSVYLFIVLFIKPNQFSYQKFTINLPPKRQHMNQSEPEALIHELKIRFQKKPRRCRKVNDSYIGYAERIVSISNNTFYYYPTIQEFQDMDFDKLQYVIPKAGVKLTDIMQLKFPPRRTNERNFFSIIIPKNKILKFTKAMKQIIVDEYAQGEQTWTFNFSYDIIALPQRQHKQKQSLQKQNIQEKIREEQMRKQRELDEKAQKEKIRQEYNSLLQAEEMQVQEDDDYKKKRQELNQKQNREKIIKQSDQLFFTKVYRRIVQMTNQNELDNIKIACEQIQLLKVIGNFRERAEATVRQFIDEWPYTMANQKIKKNVYYKLNNLNLKIGDKNINQQFLSNVCVANAILKCQKQITKALRVPLIALIKYKGFKLFVRACTSVDSLDARQLDDAIVHGNCSDNWKSNFLVMDNLSTVSDVLKLKPYNSQVHYQKVQIHLGTSLKVIQTSVDPYADIKKLDPSRLSQPENNYKLYYLYDINEIFPIDLDLEDNVNQSTIRLRPEFIDSYIDHDLEKTRLVGGSLLYSVEDEEGEKEDVIVAKAAQHFKFVTLYKFVKNLDNLKYIPYNSQSLGKIMKSQGVNIRYIGTIFKSTQLPYIKTIIEVQGISRIIKIMYRQFQHQFCQMTFKEDPQVSRLMSQAFSPKSALSLKKMRIKQLKKLESEKSISNAIDYLNLVFGTNDETNEFWRIVKEKVSAYFKFDITDYMSLPHGYLLKAVIYHCGFDVKITDKTVLFMTHKPFVNEDWIKFTCTIKSFDYPGLKVYSKTKERDQYSFQKNKNHLQMGLLIRRSLKKPQLQVLIPLTKYKQKFMPPRQFYSIDNIFYYLMHPSPENFDSALKVAHMILPSSHPFFTQMYLKYSQLKTSNLDIVSLKKAAQNHATRNLGITHWKTAQILSNFNQVQYLNNLKKAEIGVSAQARSKFYLQIVKEEIHLGLLVQCSGYVRKSIQIFGLSTVKLTEQEIQHYFEIMMLGMEANYKMRRIQNLVKISEYMWLGIEKYWDIKYLPWFRKLLEMTIKCFLQSYERKHYLYKVVIVLKKQISHKISQSQVEDILLDTFYKCKQSKNHVNWTKDLLIKLQFGYLEINFKNDFFTNFWRYTEVLANEDLEEGLKQVHDLLHILGQSYFQLALLDRIYSFEKGMEMAVTEGRDNKEKTR